MSSVHPVKVVLSSNPPLDDANARIRAIVNPPAACMLCYYERGEFSPPGTTATLCDRHRKELETRSDALKSGRR